MAKCKTNLCIPVNTSRVKTRTAWTVKPYTRIEKPKTAFRRAGKGRTPYGDRRMRVGYCD